MGHYTGIAINVKLHKDITDKQIDILQCMTFNVAGEKVYPSPDRDHPMFKDDRWTMALSCQSAYLHECEVMQPPQGERFKKLKDGRWLLRAAASTKSYGLMSKLLLDWLAPLVDKSEYGKICGEYRYEYTAPTRFGFNENGVFKVEPESKIDNDGYDESERNLEVDMEEK